MSSLRLYLASASPRRRELLAQIGVPCEVLATHVDEAVLRGETAAAYVVRLAGAKARVGWSALQPPDAVSAGVVRGAGAAVLGADTAVLLGDVILGKPADRADALRMLALLSGRTHEVLTAVALVTARGVVSALSRSEVTFRTIGFAEAQRYWETGEPADKAGAYAVQGRAAVFVTRLQGSYSGVMGLPLHETAGLLDAAGVARWS